MGRGENCTCGCKNAGQGESPTQAIEQSFPCDYMFKVIGFSGEGFMAEVKAACEKVLGPFQDDWRLSSRASRNQRYLSVTVEAPVDSYDTACRIYALLKDIEGVVALL